MNSRPDFGSLQGFCSESCYNKYITANTKQCSLAGCIKGFHKDRGIYMHGHWFCSEAHCEEHPEIKKMQAMAKQLASNQVEMEEEDYEIDL